LGTNVICGISGVTAAGYALPIGRELFFLLCSRPVVRNLWGIPNWWGMVELPSVE